MMKHTLTAAALAVAMATPAFAQTATPDAPAMNKQPTTQMAPGSASSTTGAMSDQTFVSSQQSTDWLGSKLIGASVYGPDNASIGEVNDVVIASDGKINAVVVGVGGFLGVGEKNVALAFDQLNVTRKPDSAAIDKITVSFTKDQLKSAPTFAYYAPKGSTTTGSGAATPARPATAPMAPGGATTTPSAPAK